MNKEKDIRPLMVSIRCIAYNQGKYIRDALEGFVMQKANFRFEAVVHDDASTDNTAAIIREYAEKYPEIIKPIYETENQYSKHDGSLCRIMDDACKGKYIAYCEGDDYWIDPLKLQKQVDFMETHTDYSMCWTDAFEDNSGIKNPYNRYADSGRSPMEDIIEGGGGFIPTCSIVTRHDALKSRPSVTKCWYVGDFPLQMWLGWVGKCWYMKEQTCVYRYMAVGSWTEKHSKNNDSTVLYKRYENDRKMMDAFNKLTEYKYNESFEKYAATNLYTWLLIANGYNSLKYQNDLKLLYQLRKKYGIYTGKRDVLLIHGHPHLAQCFIWLCNLKSSLMQLGTRHSMISYMCKII